MTNPLTQKRIEEICIEQNLYITPELNEILYLHMKGFTGISGLTDYINLKTLYLNNNLLSQIENLSYNINLRVLYLHENQIESLQNLSQLVNLATLNVSSNFISQIENIQGCKLLSTLNISHNRLSSLKSISQILLNQNIKTLDISNNNIEDVEIIPQILTKLPFLSVLYLKGNPVIKKIPNYRKNLIASIPSLKYLDDRPITDEERTLAVAFMKGGVEEEKKERKIIQDEKENEYQKQLDFLKEIKISHQTEDNSLNVDSLSLSDDDDEKEKEEKEEPEEIGFGKKTTQQLNQPDKFTTSTTFITSSDSNTLKF